MKMTGVGAILSAAHRDRETGALHGHTWEITAWVMPGRSAIVHQEALRAVLAKIDHTELPSHLAWGEDLAEWIAGEMVLRGSVPIEIVVARPAERLFAKWNANHD